MIAALHLARRQVQLDAELGVATSGELHELPADDRAERAPLQQAERVSEVAAARSVDVDHGSLQVGDRDRASLEREPADAPRPELRAQAAVLDDHLVLHRWLRGVKPPA